MRGGVPLVACERGRLLSCCGSFTSCLSWRRDPALVAKPLVGPKVSRDIYVLVKAGRSLSPAAQQFVSVLKKTLGAGW